MSVIFSWLANHKALLAALVYAGALAVQGQYEAAVGVVLAALSGGIKPVPAPAAAPAAK
jgi:hypothetical protein